MDWNAVRLRYLPQDRYTATIIVALVSFLSFFVVLPIGAMFAYSFMPNFPVTEGVGFTLEHYIYLLERHEFMLQITWNTFIYAGGVTIASLAIGMFLVFVTVKYLNDSVLQFPVQLLILLPFALPSIAALTGWIILLGSNGIITRLVMWITRQPEPLWDLYTLQGMVWVEGLHIAPIAFLLLLPAVRSVPAAMEEVSIATGATKMYTIRKVVIPVIWPSVLSTAIFIFARTMATVGTPSILGASRGFHTFGSAIPFVFLAGANISYSRALSFSVFLTTISAVLIYYYLKVQAKEEKYTTVTGQGNQEILQYSSGRLTKSALLLVVVLYVTVGGILPFGAIILDSLNTTFDYVYDVRAFTVEQYILLFTNNAPGISADIGRLFGNTFFVSLIVPTTTMTVALLIAYSNQTLNVPFGRFYSFLGAVVLAVPGIAKGLGYLVTFIVTPVYGTVWILFIAFHGNAIPVAMRYASPAITKLGKENFEAGVSVGDNPLRVFRKITIPLVSEDYIAGWTHMYVSIMRNIPIAILLYARGAEILSVELFWALDAGYFKTASTLAVIITILSTIPYLILQYYSFRRNEFRRR